MQQATSHGRRPARRRTSAALRLSLVAALLAPGAVIADPGRRGAAASVAGAEASTATATATQTAALTEASTGASIDGPSIDRSSIDGPSIDRPSIDRPSIDRPSIDRPPAASSRTARPNLRAVRAAVSPRLDGSLDDPAWQTAPATDAFTQKFPDDGQRPSERTLLRVVYDDDALYVGFDCEQVKTPLVARLARRDRDPGADRVEVAISDGARTFSFWVNAAGVLGDGIRFNDTDYSADWDGVWDSQVRRRADGWSAEMRIPLMFFRVDPEAIQDWGLQARRYVSARQETDEWAYAPRTVAGEVSNYGRLSGLAGLTPGHTLELRPFVAAHGARGTGGQTSYGATAGLDARWHMTPNATLDLTVNPDFAQVEADEQVLNLTTFETFFPEKRPFFLDGMDMFQMPRMAYFPSDQTLFYTRRIGAVAAEPAVRDDGERVASIPEPVTIYTAAKLRGTLGDVLTGSLMSAVTGRGDVTVQQADGSRRDALAAPPSWFNVARVRAALGDRAQVGLLATATQRFEPTGNYPRLGMPDGATGMQLCPSGEMVAAGARCFHDSYVASADGYWRSASGDYVVSGQAVMSAIEGGPARTMLDGTVISSGDVGTGASLYAAKEGGNWLSSVEVEADGRRLDYNDLGFMLRQNHLRLLPTVEYRAIEPFGPVAEARTRFSASFRDTVDGLNLWRGYYASTEWRLKSSWTASTMFYYLGNRFDDREIGDGSAIERRSGVGWDMSVTSDPGSRISGSVSTETVVRSDGHEFSGSAQVDFHVLPQLELQVLPLVSSTTGEMRYVAPYGQPGGYLFGRLDAQSVGATLRANYTLTTHLTFQLYTQALLISKHYHDFQSSAADHARPAIRLTELTPAAAPSDNPDGQEATLDVNAVLRWEFQPGSTLFVVYTRSQAPARMLETGERAALDLGALRRGPAADALLLKASYWWN